MLSRGPVAHLAADSGLFEFNVINVETSAFDIPQLAGVTHCANSLVVGRVVEFLPGAGIGALASRPVNDLPEIDPLLLEHVVLNGKNVNLAIRQLGGVGLLKLRADCVIDRIAVPFAIGLPDIEVKAVVPNYHASK